MADMKVYTHTDGRIIWLGDPDTSRRWNFYGEEHFAKDDLIETDISPLTEPQIDALCIDYFLKKVNGGAIVDMTSNEKVAACEVKFATYLANPASAPSIKSQCLSKWGVVLP